MKSFGTGNICLAGGAGDIKVASASFYDYDTIPSALPPVHINTWLGQMGWHCKDGRWKREPDVNAPSYTWEQAVAIEFYRFVTVGGR